MVLSDKTIRALCAEPNSGVDRKPMITPFEPNSVRQRSLMRNGFKETKRILSYGTSSYGYDVTLAPEFKVFVPVVQQIIDPLEMDAVAPENVATITGDSYVLPPLGFVLSYTLETFCIPRDVVIQCLAKSTYARLGVFVNVTPIEPEFEGQVVLEIFNSNPLPVRIHANQGIAQFMFFRGDQPCEVSYKDRDGKYQGQSGIQMSKV